MGWIWCKFIYFISNQTKNDNQGIYLIEVKGELRTEEELNAIAADISKAKLNLEEHISLGRAISRE